MLVAHRKFFLAVQTQVRVQSNPFLKNIKQSKVPFPFETSTKIEKSPQADVWIVESD